MTLGVLLKKMTELLTDAGIVTARLDTLLLMEDVTGKERAWILAHHEFVLDKKSIIKLGELVKRRANHEPLAYIRGRSEFYGREFLVTPDTLQPRSETETMIDLLKNLLEHNYDVSRVRPWKMVDVGTGSGCLAITAKLEWPEAEVYATEINGAALKVAKMNAVKLRADVKFYKGNLLQPVSSLASSPLPLILLCNLPYVPDNHTINKAAMQEPAVAIFGGEDGLDLYRELFIQIRKVSVAPRYVLTESLPFQQKKLAEIAKEHDYIQTEEEDFIQIFSLKTSD